MQKPPKSDSQPYTCHNHTSSEGEVQWVFSITSVYIYKQELRLNFPRREVSWWIWDYINYYPLQSITEEITSSDFQLRAITEQYKHDLSGHNLALRIQKYMYVDGTSQVQISQAYPPPTNITDRTLNYLKNL